MPPRARPVRPYVFPMTPSLFTTRTYTPLRPRQDVTNSRRSRSRSRSGDDSDYVRGRGKDEGNESHVSDEVENRAVRGKFRPSGVQLDSAESTLDSRNAGEVDDSRVTRQQKSDGRKNARVRRSPSTEWDMDSNHEDATKQVLPDKESAPRRYSDASSAGRPVVRDSASPAPRSYKEQGLTRSRHSDRRSPSPSWRSSRRRERDQAREQRGRTARDSSEEHGSYRTRRFDVKDKSDDLPKLSSERARKSYISPPPTVKKPAVPDAPRGRVPRKASGSQNHHDFYAMMTSDDEPSVRVKRAKKPVRDSEVFSISSDSDLPSRISPRKLEFNAEETSDVESRTAKKRRFADGDSDEDHNGNLRGFVVSDDDEDNVFAARRSRKSGKTSTTGSKEVASSRRDSSYRKTTRSSPRPVSPDGSVADGSRYNTRKNSQSSRKRDIPSNESPKRALTAKTNSGVEVDLKFKARDKPLDKGKGRRRSPSPDSDDYQPASKRTKHSARAPQSFDHARAKKKGRSASPGDEQQTPAKKSSNLHALRSSPSPGPQPSSSARALPSKVASPPRALVEDGNCCITREEDHEGFLVGTYGKCAAYSSPAMLRTPQETGAVGVSYFDAVVNGLSIFDAPNMCIKRIRSVVTLMDAADGKVVVGSRVAPDTVSTTKHTTSKNKTVVTLSRGGEPVDFVFFAFVATDGSWLQRLETPIGERAPTNQGYHALNVYPLTGEYQRILAFLHYTFAPVNQDCQMFTRGNAWQTTSMWGDLDRYAARKALPVHVKTNAAEGSASRASAGVNPALARISKGYTSDIPVFDSRRHFMNSHITGRWDENFDPENILTQ
ncbi:hypothetical protein PENSPDRAFT_671512, partial [Peniophora sp. CONT]